MKSRPRVIFAGSPEVAVASLEAVAQSYDVTLVVTQPDRRKGRGRHLHPTSVGERAHELGLDVLAVPNINRPDMVERLRACRADCIVVVSFGQMLTGSVLDLTPLGCINLHFSLLPRLRGAAPVPWAILGGHRETGVSVIKLVGKMDAGPVFAQTVEPIESLSTAEDLYGRLAAIGARLLGETLDGIFDSSVQPVEQDEALATYAPKISRADAAIDWTRPAAEVDRLIRGLSGQLEAFAHLAGKRPLRVNFYRSKLVEGRELGGGVCGRGPGGELLVGCGEGLLEVIELQAQGKRRLLGRDFANGYHIVGGERFL